MTETPIFDLTQELPAKPSRRARWMGISAGIGLVLGLTAAILRISLPEPSAAAVLVFIISIYAAIAIHECGHLIGAKAVGFGFGAISIGGLALGRSGKRWIFKFEPLTRFGGFVVPLPKPGHCSRADFVWMVAAGPAASTLFALTAGVVWLRHGGGSENWMGTMFWAATVVAALPLIPSSKGWIRSDMSSLLHLIREKESSKSWMAAWQLQTADANGVRPRDWDSDLFQQMLANSGSDSEISRCNLSAYYRRTDEGEPESALIYLERALAKSAKLPARFRTQIFLEAAFISATFRHDAVQAREWLQRGIKVGKPKSTAPVDAAIAMCEERYADAIGFFADATTGAEKLDSGITRFAKAGWADFQDQCRTALTASADKHPISS